MFTSSNRITNNKLDPSNYIEDYDVYNSILIDKLRDPSITRSNYVINTYEFRPDLIARDFYGDSKYMGIMMLSLSLDLSQYTKGTVLEMIPKASIDAIVNVQ